MQYRLELEEDNGYIISNAPPNPDGGATPEQVRGPGIRMSVELASPSPDRIFEQFEFNEDNWENPAFRACYQQTLRGMRTGWKLVTVEVTFGHLFLEFVSEERYQELEQEGDHDMDSPYYSETVSFFPDEKSYAQLQFEVERLDGLGFDIYQLKMSKGLTEVTEFVGHQKRVIKFLPPTPPADGNNLPRQWVKVFSYC